MPLIDGLDQSRVIPNPASQPVDSRLSQAKRARLAKRIIKRKLAFSINEIRYFVSLFQHPQVVAYIIIGGERQHHQVRPVLPDMFTQGNQLLRGSITRNPEVDYLNLLPAKSATLLQTPLQQRPESILLWYLESFGVRVTNYCDSKRIRRLCESVPSVAQAITADLDKCITLFAIPTRHVWPQ